MSGEVVVGVVAYFLPRAGLSGPWRVDWLLSHARVYATRNLVAAVFWLLPHEIALWFEAPLWAGLWLILMAGHAVAFGVMLGVWYERR